MSAEFRAEIVINTNISLQQEKLFVEQELGELRRRRFDLENTLDGLKTKLLQTKEMNTRMNAAVHLAAYKVLQSETQLNSLRNCMEKSNETVKRLKTNINKLKEEKSKDIEGFLRELDLLAERFIEAKKAYSDSQLSQQLEETLLEIANIKHFADDLSAQKEDLIASLENAKFDKGTVDSVTEQQQKYIISMITEEINYLNSVTQTLLEEHQNLKGEMDNI